MDLSTVLLLGAAIAFALDGFRITHDRLNWTPLGYCLVVLSVLV